MSSKRLALTWFNQDKALLPLPEGGYEWVERDDPRVTEVRLLAETERVGDVCGTPADNLLIVGDAYQALHALNSIPEYAEEYRGKVKLVYIDPPFNTEQTFGEFYDDNFDHSVWLTMFRDRVKHLSALMCDEGVIWVHLDDAEVHRARMVLDEEFGIGNHLGTVVWQKADGPRNDLPNFSPDHDTLLVYGKSPAASLNRTERDESLNSIYKSADGDPMPWYDGDPTAPSAHRNQTWVYAIQSPITGDLMYPANGRCWGTKQETVFSALSEFAPYRLEVIDDDERRAEVCGVPVDELRKGIPALLLDVPLEEANKLAEKRKAAGMWPEYIIRPKGSIGRKRYQPDKGVNSRTMWFNSDVGHNREAKAEIKALFPKKNPFSTPKPERLLRRIVEVSSVEGDVVVDVFAGSGTTAAVAHKMGRRWITVEAIDATVDGFTKPRLAAVVSGADRGGVSVTKARVAAAGVALPPDMTPQDAYEFSKRLGTLFGESGEQADDEVGEAAEEQSFEPIGVRIDIAAELSKLTRAAMKTEAPPLSEEEAKALLSMLRRLPERHLDLTKQVKSSLVNSVKTKNVSTTNWTGGGGFRVLKVENPRLEVRAGRAFLKEDATNFGAFVAAQLGYHLVHDRRGVAGVKGRDVLVVVRGLIDEEQVRVASSVLEEAETVTLAGSTVHPNAAGTLADLRPGSRVVKVPNGLYKQSKVIR